LIVQFSDSFLFTFPTALYLPDITLKIRNVAIFVIVNMQTEFAYNFFKIYYRTKFQEPTLTVHCRSHLRISHGRHVGIINGRKLESTEVEQVPVHPLLDSGVIYTDTQHLHCAWWSHEVPLKLGMKMLKRSEHLRCRWWSIILGTRRGVYTSPYTKKSLCFESVKEKPQNWVDSRRLRIVSSILHWYYR